LVVIVERRDHDDARRADLAGWAAKVLEPLGALLALGLVGVDELEVSRADGADGDARALTASLISATRSLILALSSTPAAPHDWSVSTFSRRPLPGTRPSWLEIFSTAGFFSAPAAVAAAGASWAGALPANA
jgi:hypothetical protein